MTRVYITGADEAHAVLDRILAVGADGRRVLRNGYGKPYIEGGGFFFNLTHSGGFGAVAVSGKPVGVDMERVRGASHGPYMRSLSPAEREEIVSERDFLRHFTAREAYVKMKGSSILAMYRHLEFLGGTMYEDGVALGCAISSFDADGFVLSVCGGDGRVEIVDTRGEDAIGGKN